MSATYVIIDADVVPEIDFSEVYETNANTLRWNVDPEHTKTFVKFSSDNPTPSFLDGLEQYTHAEILAILATAEWTPQE